MIDDDVAVSDAAKDAPDDAFDVPARAPLAALLLLPLLLLLLLLEKQRDRADRATTLARSSRRRIVESWSENREKIKK